MVRRGGSPLAEMLCLGEATVDASDGESTVWLWTSRVIHELAAVGWSFSARIRVDGFENQSFKLRLRRAQWDNAISLAPD